MAKQRSDAKSIADPPMPHANPDDASGLAAASIGILGKLFETYISKKRLTRDQIGKLSDSAIRDMTYDKRDIPVLLQIRNIIRRTDGLARRRAKRLRQMSRGVR